MKKRIAFMMCFICLMTLLCALSASARTDFLPAWPLRQGYNISALDVYQSGSSHAGIDVGHGNQPTQDVYAVAAGKVTSVGNQCSHKNAYPHDSKKCSAGNLGNFVTIRHDVNGKVFYSQYGHLTKNSIAVKVGDTVTANTKIGKMGSSGNSTGPHLHFVIYEKSYTADRAKRTFDFYKDNAELMKTLRIRQKLAEKSKLYGKWIKENGTLKGELYYFDGSVQQTESKPAIDLTQYPSSITQGSAFGLRGTITSDYKITSVKGYILDSKGNAVQTTTDAPNAKSMDIRPASLNQKLLFDKLPAGTYKLKVVAADTNGGHAEWEKAFTVKSKSGTATNTANSSNKSSGQTIADGVYVIATKLNTSYVLDIAGSSKHNGANLQLWESNGTAAQKFKVTHIGGGYYQIVNVNSGRAMDAANGGTAAGTNVWQYGINNSDAQLWKIVSAGGGSYHMIGKGSGLYLDVDNAHADSGTNVKIFDRNDAYDAQKWCFLKTT